MTYNELLGILGMADKLIFNPKSDRNLGSHKEIWCEFHKGFGHDVEHYIALGYPVTWLDNRWIFEGVLGRDPGGVEGRSPFSGTGR